MVGLSSKNGYYYPLVKVVSVQGNTVEDKTNSIFDVNYNTDIYFYIDLNLTEEEYINKLRLNFTFNLDNASDKLYFKIFKNYNGSSEKNFDSLDKGEISSPDFSIDLVDGYNKVSLDIGKYAIDHITSNDTQIRIRAKLTGIHPSSSGKMNVKGDLISGSLASYSDLTYSNKLSDNLSYSLNYDRNTFVLNMLGLNYTPLNFNLDLSSSIIFNKDLTFKEQSIFKRSFKISKIKDEDNETIKFYIYDNNNHPYIYYLLGGYVYRCFDINSFIVDDPDDDLKILINGEEYLIDRETNNIVQITKNNKTLYFAYDENNLLTRIFYNEEDENHTEKNCVQFSYSNSLITEMQFQEESKKIVIEYDAYNKIKYYFLKNINSSNDEFIDLKIEYRYLNNQLQYIIINDYLNYSLSYSSNNVESSEHLISNITSIDVPTIINSILISRDNSHIQIKDKYNNTTKYYFDKKGNIIYSISTDSQGLVLNKQCNVNNSNNIKQPKNVFLNNLYEDVNFVRVTNSTYYTVTNKQDQDGVVNIENVYDGLNSKEYHFDSTGNSVERTIETSLGVSGKANEVLSVTALARANLNPTDYLKVQLKFKYKAKYEYEYQTYEFSFNSNDGTEQFNGMNVLSKYDYDDISLIIKYKGKQVSYISNIFVNKALIRPEIIYDENGKACGYTNENQMYISKSEFTTSPETVKNEVYNSGEQIKKSYRNGLITKEENLMTKDKVVYTYNDNNDLISKTTTIDKYTDTETYEYDENNELSMSSHNDQKTFYLNKQDLNTKINHIINPDGLFNRIVQTKKNLNEEVVQYTNQLNDLLEKHDFYYENGLLKTIKTKDLDIYKFEYDSLNRIKKIFFNDVLYIEYGYSDNDLVTTKKYSNTNIINFGYDGHNRISQVQYNNGSSTQTLATYIYDEYNRIIEIDDIDGNYHIYEYDNDNNIISEDQVDHSIQYDYNLKGELNNTRYNFNGEKHITSINSYDSTRNKFIEKISNEVYCDYLMHAGHSSLYGHINNSVSTTYDDVLKINVMELSMQNEDIIVDSLLNLNKDNGVVYNNQIFDGNTYIEKIKDCYNALAFIKVESPFTQTTPIMRFYKKTIEDENGYKNEYDYYLKILISSSNEVIIIHEKKLCDTADPSLTIGQVTILREKYTGNYININKWNIIGFTNRPTSEICEAIVNDSIIEVGIVKKMEYDNFRVLGNDSNPIKLVYLSCGYRIIDQNKLSMIYNEFNSIFNESKKEKISLITDYDCLDTYELDKVSLNNTFKTYRGITPNILYTKDEYANDSERFFIYDEEINKYCYLADKNRNSFLSYGLSSNSNNFIISGYFKLFKMDIFSHNTFFTICDKQTNNEIIKVTYKYPQVYLYINGSSVTSKKIDFEYNKFNYFTFKKQSNSIIITVNNIELTYNTNLSMTDINLIIGNDNNNFAFNGLFSDMIFGYPLTDIDINDYNYQNTQFISDYDSFGRVRSKQIKPKNSNNVIKTVYSYYDETDENDKTILKSTINRIKNYDGSEEIISYDENYNIIKRVVIKDDIITNVINYEYDDFRRLKKETRHTISMSNIVTENYSASFEYDYNGNITRMIINENGDLVKDLYFTYSSDNTNRLISVYDDWEGITKTITYNNLLYPSSYNNKSITYRGNQVLKIGDVSFEYDSLGNRVLKNYDGTDTRYYYDGNKLIRQENEDGYIIDYIYTNNVLEGLKYNNEEYYFVRDITGSIEKIIDKNKTVMVVYSYTSYGEVTKNINTSLTGTRREIAQILLNNNGFVYKGYYYDVETSLFWISSRYYSPELCRFISPDDVSYLDPESVNGLNLYCYCLNDPVNNIDPTGHFVITAAMIWAAIGIGAAIGAAFGLGSTVAKDLDNGKLFDGDVSLLSYIGNTLGGGVAGAGVGLCSVLGAGLGVALTTGTALSIGGTAISGGTALLIGAGGAFVSGGLGYAVRTGISDQETFEWSDMFIDAGANAISGVLTFAGAMVGGIMGVKVPGAKFSLKNFALYHLGAAYFGVYPSKFIISYIKEKLKEMY